VSRKCSGTGAKQLPCLPPACRQTGPGRSTTKACVADFLCTMFKPSCATYP
jgi:hypothetical protein